MLAHCLPLKLWDCFLLPKSLGVNSCFWILLFLLCLCSIVSSVMFMAGSCYTSLTATFTRTDERHCMKITFSGNNSCQSKYVSASTVSVRIHGSYSDKRGTFFLCWENSSWGRKTLQVTVLVSGLSVTEDRNNRITSATQVRNTFSDYPTWPTGNLFMSLEDDALFCSMLKC